MAATDVLVWTEAGLAALARARQWDTYHHGADTDAQLRDHVRRAHERFAPAWERGLADADATGREAARYTTAAVCDGALPGDASVEQAAWVASLFGGYADVIGALLEQIVRERGVRFALAVLVRMWSLRTTAREASPRSEDGLAVWLTAIADDHLEVGDEYGAALMLGSRGKGKAARYLLRTYQAAAPDTRAAMRAAVDALWPTAPPQAWTPLALATDDAARAGSIARTILPTLDHLLDDNGTRIAPYPYFAMAHLPYLVTDANLVGALLARGGHVDIRILANLGGAALPLYAQALTSQESSTWRLPLLEELCNLRGPGTARIMAAYAERRPYGTLVHNYFAEAPELLTGLRRVRSLAAHRPNLEELERRLGIATSRTRTRR